MSDTAQIVKGEDRILTLSIKVKRKEGDPFDLTGFTKISAEFRLNDNSILKLTTDPADGVFASVIYEGVTFTADTIGVVGNAISLTFDGIDDVDTVVAAWNGANPGNTASHSGAGTEVLSAGVIPLVDGVDDVIYVTLLGDPLLGKIQVEVNDTNSNRLRLGKSQSIRVKIDKGEIRRIAIFRNAIDVVNPQF